MCGRVWRVLGVSGGGVEGNWMCMWRLCMCVLGVWCGEAFIDHDIPEGGVSLKLVVRV